MRVQELNGLFQPVGELGGSAKVQYKIKKDYFELLIMQSYFRAREKNMQLERCSRIGPIYISSSLVFFGFLLLVVIY